MTAAARTIAAFEIARLFRRPFAWIVLTLAEWFMAIVFLVLIVRFIDMDPASHSTSVTGEILMRYFHTAALLVIIITPMLTMGVVSSDRREGKLSFMFSTPVSSADIVVGKLLGILSLACALWLLIGVIPLTLLWGAPIDLGVYLTNMLGLVLLIGMHCCLGLMASAMTRQPVVAGLIALFISLALWFADWADRLDPASSSLGTISTLGRLRGFALGFVNSADVVYFLVGALAFALMAMWLVETERRYA